MPLTKFLVLKDGSNNIYLFCGWTDHLSPIGHLDQNNRFIPKPERILRQPKAGTEENPPTCGAVAIGCTVVDFQDFHFISVERVKFQSPPRIDCLGQIENPEDIIYYCRFDDCESCHPNNQKEMRCRKNNQQLANYFILVVGYNDDCLPSKSPEA